MSVFIEGRNVSIGKGSGSAIFVEETAGGEGEGIARFRPQSGNRAGKDREDGLRGLSSDVNNTRRTFKYIGKHVHAYTCANDDMADVADCVHDMCNI